VYRTPPCNGRVGSLATMLPSAAKQTSSAEWLHSTGRTWML
jgi:hypothetical protein